MRPPDDNLLVDVFFTGFAFDAFNTDGLLPSQRAIVERHGAVILRSYHVMGARVWIPTDSIPGLTRFATVRTVPDPRRYDTAVLIVMKQGSDWRADSLRIAELGGRVLSHQGFSYYAFAATADAILPNRSAPKLRERSSVIGVFAAGEPGCGILFGPEQP